MIKPNRRQKSVIACIFLVFVLFSTQWSNYQLHKAFLSRAPKKPILPTTSHTQAINLKKFSSSDFEAQDLRSQLASHFPYDPSSRIPRRIWQTWKNSPSDKKFPPAFTKNMNLWKEMAKQNSEQYDYHLVTDMEIPMLLENLYGSVPYVLQAYNSLPLQIMKADFFRYLILYARGGVYSDMDTFPLKSFDSWFSTNSTILKKYQNQRIAYGNSQNSIILDSADEGGENDGEEHGAKGLGKGQKQIQEPGLVIGIEADPDREDWFDHYTRRVQFCQWTLQAKSGHPLLRELIVNITATTLQSMAKLVSLDTSLPKMSIEESNANDYNVNFRHNRKHDTEYKHNVKKTPKNTDTTDIMNWTGPGIFTDIIFEYFSNLLQKNEKIVIYNDNLSSDEISLDSDSHTNTMRFNKQISASLISRKPKMEWQFFSLMKSPVIVDDILVLPITCFSPGVGHMNAEEDDHPFALVKHDFEGTWKSEKTSSGEEQKEEKEQDE